jgi:primase-polymerase (primpol)-like protein
MIAARCELLPVQPEGIPEELKARPQWVNFEAVPRLNGRLDKVPYTPGTRRKASSTDLLTWGTFEDALAGLDHLDGVGFVFCSGDPYVGVDLDNCVDPQTGEINVWAWRIIEVLDSYTEYSPTGKGVHIIVKGRTPSAVKRDEIEMYSTMRFFTITGHVIEVRLD